MVGGNKLCFFYIDKVMSNGFAVTVTKEMNLNRLIRMDTHVVEWIRLSHIPICGLIKSYKSNQIQNELF